MDGLAIAIISLGIGWLLGFVHKGSLDNHKEHKEKKTALEDVEDALDRAMLALILDIDTVTVPKEPTEAMLLAASEYDENSKSQAIQVYKAMIEAAQEGE